MTTGQTKIANLIDPQVMADMIDGKIASKIVVTPLQRLIQHYKEYQETLSQCQLMHT